MGESAIRRGDALRKAITDAFQEIPCPGDDRIVSHKCWECDEVAAKLKGTRWEEWVDKPGELSMRGAGIFLLSAEGFRYFLPAFLIASLKDNSNFISDALLSALEDPNLASIKSAHIDENWYRRRMAGFSSKQLAAIRQYLSSLPPEGDIHGSVTRALKSIEGLERAP